jgi:HNH endonuclease
MPRYSEQELRDAIGVSDGYAATLRTLGLCQTGGNNQVLKRWIDQWEIDVSHFPTASERARRNPRLNAQPTPVEEYLIEGKVVNGNHLKRKLYQSNLKTPVCELCGQDENWRGMKMSLILDHINGVHDDNRIENLRIVCPNCNATLDTHCGKKNKKNKRKSKGNQRGIPRLGTRKVIRPSFEDLMQELTESNYSEVGRKYGVTDNAVRKWKRFYEDNAESY